MPDSHQHMLLDMHFFDVPYGSTKYVHDLLDHGDIDYVRLFGVKHRQFMHDRRAIAWIESQYGPFAGLVAKLHIAIDIVWSYSKRKENE